MMRSLFFVMMILCANAFADMQANRVASKMAYESAPPTYQVPVAAIQTYYQDLKKTRTLSDEETMTHNLTMVAATLKAESITSWSKDAASVQLARVNEAIVSKIKTHPKWDVSLSATQLQAITPHLEIIKNTMGEKSYGWAWFLKQNGKTAEAKQLLVSLFDERVAGVMQMTGTHSRQSPLMPVIEVEQALLPLSTEAEKTKMQKKMQDVKVHVSNLQEYMIQT
jgi:hypothetical protein